jgi:16S rRNA (cytosine967-C5)-methyltransferase
VLERVQRAGAYADVMLNAHLARSALPAADRAFATDLVNGTLRWRGQLDFLIARVLDRNLDKLEPLVANALRLGAYQIVRCERVPNTAAVDQTVRCVRAAGAERATGLVNAVLRRLAAEHREIAPPSLENDPLGHLTHALSLPAWLASRWLTVFGPEETAALARASNEVPPLTVRANRLRTSAPELLVELRERFPDAAPCHYAEDGLVLGRRGNPAIDPAFLGGRFTVQDEASQLVVTLLDPHPGERILETCAAPGGKTTAIGERLGADGHSTATRVGSTSCAATCDGWASGACSASSGMRRGRSRTWPSPARSTACWWTPPARAWERCDATPTRAGASAPGIRCGSPRSSSRFCGMPPPC